MAKPKFSRLTNWKIIAVQANNLTEHYMTNKISIAVLVLMLTFLSSCSAIGDIFKAGAAVGVIAVVIVIAVIIWIISLFRGRS
jgi:hypothetical protein